MVICGVKFIFVDSMIVGHYICILTLRYFDFQGHEQLYIQNAWPKSQDFNITHLNPTDANCYVLPSSDRFFRCLTITTYSINSTTPEDLTAWNWANIGLVKLMHFITTFHHLIFNKYIPVTQYPMRWSSSMMGTKDPQICANGSFKDTLCQEWRPPYPTSYIVYFSIWTRKML